MKEILVNTIQYSSLQSFLDRTAVKIAAIELAPKRLHAILKELLDLVLVWLRFNLMKLL
jgi:hypothetical protein